MPEVCECHDSAKDFSQLISFGVPKLIIQISAEEIRQVEEIYRKHVYNLNLEEDKSVSEKLRYYIGAWLIFASCNSRATKGLGYKYLVNNPIPEAKYLLAKYHIIQGNNELALELLLSLRESYPRASNDLGYFAHRAGDLIKADHFYKIAIKHGYNSYFNLGSLHYKDNVDFALECFEQGAALGDQGCIHNLLIHYENNNDLVGLRKIEDKYNVSMYNFV